MSNGQRRDRGALLALGMALFAVAVLAFITTRYSSEDSRGHRQQQQLDGTNRSPEVSFGRQILGADSLSSYEKPCVAGQDDRTSDLCAQWKAADATKEAADWTRLAYWLVLVGTVFGGLTLLAAVAAARYARDAALHTKYGAEAANNSFELTRRQIFIENRPLVSIGAELIGNLYWTEGQISINVDVQISNVGSAPAFEVKVGITPVPVIVRAKEEVREFTKQIQNDVINSEFIGDTLIQGTTLSARHGVSFEIKSHGSPSMIFLEFIIFVHYKGIINAESTNCFTSRGYSVVREQPEFGDWIFEIGEIVPDKEIVLRNVVGASVVV